MSKDHSEPAFPSNSHEYGPVLGLSIRDYFAAKAMQGLQSIYWDTVDKYDTAEDVLSCMAQSAYEIADAMLKERAK